MASKPQYDFNVNLDDLTFILKQIKIAEGATNPDGSVNGAALRNAVGSPLLPWGLRTVDGTWNNLVPGMERTGAADNIMPHLVPNQWHKAEDVPDGFFGPPSPFTPSGSTSYAQTAQGNIVFDSQPRIISNLIVDQTTGNPAAVAAAQERAENATYPGLDKNYELPNGELLIPNQSPDIGLSPPFNGMMALFGQFFDHGLDLISKGGGTVFVPLKPDDPLYVEGGHSNFMVLSRAANKHPGPDGKLGTADDLTGYMNTTTPFIDQNQTYTSHPSHQVFLREYAMVDGKPLATGHLLDGAHGTGNWAEVKAQAAALLGIQLLDTDIFNVPLLATDRYGEFLRGPNGFVQIVTAGNVLIEGNPAANGGLGVALPANTIRTGHAFLDDIAHNAVPGTWTDRSSGAPVTKQKVADEDDVAGNPVAPGTYDDELLDRHFITGDGRGNENIGLSAIHGIFHSEHNRLVDAYKETILASGDLAFINEWLAVDITELPADPSTLQWDGERLFQAGRFVNEMQYQHMVFEEFARAVQPSIDPFVFSNSADIDPAIVEEFANVVYRFGHSMLNDTVARTDANMNSNDLGLIEAFLNPIAFDDNGSLSVKDAMGQIVRGMSRQVGNEIDEFVTDALRNNLVGLPLDLATLNIARARDTGAPSFNEARAAFYKMSGDSQLKPYTSWADFAPHMKNPASIINFIAAYGLHPTITSATTLEAKRAAATLLVMGDIDLNKDGRINDPSKDGDGDGIPDGGPAEAAPGDRLDFLNSEGTWTAANSGLNKVDFWIGGLAEAKLEFGGMLAPTFNFVFESQMEKLQNGDRFYYLSRTQGLNMLNELEANSFAAMVMRNTDLGDAGNTSHLPGHLFTTPSYILEMNRADQRTGIGTDGKGDPGRHNPVLNAFTSLVTRVAPGADGNGGQLIYAYDGPDHVVLGGTPGNDTLKGGRGMDTLWGDAGDDRLDGGDEADEVHGGDGDDIITDHGTPAGAADFLRGDAGNDVISNGTGNDVVFGGTGQDFFIVGPDFTEVFAGEGNDFAIGGNGPDLLMGNEGDDWLEGGEGFDTLAGDNSQLFFNSSIIGHDVLNGQGNDTDYDGESGDDIMVQGAGIQRSNGMLGFDWAIHKGDPTPANSDLGIPLFGQQDQFILRDRFDSVEALSGWKLDDVLIGTVRPTGAAGGEGGGGIIGGPASASMLLQKNVALIAGFQELLGKPAVDDPNAVVFDPSTGGDILIGGAGSDKITGKAGNDLIDGDAWLNVRVSVRSKTDPNVEIRSVDSIAELREDMLSGAINPGQLRIVREILQSTTKAGEVDQAIYSDLRANYNVDRNADNTWTVVHARGTGADGTDTLRNIEELVFIDDIMNLTGEPSISDMTPTERQPLTALPGTVAAFSNVPESAISYQWQALVNGVFVDIAGATGATFVPQQAQVGLQLRVVARFADEAGVSRAIPSAATKGVGDYVLGTASSETLTGTAFDDELVGLGGNDVLNGGLGADLMAGGTGNDTYMVDDLGDVIVEDSGAGTDTVQTTLQARILADNLEHLTFAGTGNFTGTGNALANTITGGNGNDTLDGAGGSDRLVGGLGDDTYVVGETGDVVVEGVNAGIDLVRTALGAHTLATNVEMLEYTGTGNFAGTGNTLGNRIVGGAGNDVLDGGGGGNDQLIGLDGNDTLRGQGGDDALEGGLGDDFLDGGTGNDQMTGGAGDDTYVVSSTLDAVIEAGGEGNDTVRTLLTNYTLGENVEDLVFTGTAAFRGTGNALANQITGGSGGDTLDGGAGVDILTGGRGNDIYIVDEVLDNLVELAGQGTDTVRTALSTYALLDDFENLTFTGTGPFIGRGNGLANAITGGAGNDLLDGGAGADRLTGGAGNDIYLVDNAGDVVVESTGAAAGIDEVRATAASYTLGTNVENLVFVGTGNFSGTGNSLNNTITGGAGNDTLNGGAGSDRLIGGLGDDTYVVSASTDVIVELAGEGVDTVMSISTSYVLGAEVENAIQTSGTANLTGNALANTLRGGTGADTLRGMDGDDRLEGGAGNDRLEGGAGNDVFVFGAAGFGADTIAGGLDFDPAGGQDLLDISGLGITAANFGSSVTFTDLGADLRVTIGTMGSFVLQGVGNPADITIDDFVLQGAAAPAASPAPAAMTAPGELLGI